MLLCRSSYMKDPMQGVLNTEAPIYPLLYRSSYIEESYIYKYRGSYIGTPVYRGSYIEAPIYLAQAVCNLQLIVPPWRRTPTCCSGGRNCCGTRHGGGSQ